MHAEFNGLKQKNLDENKRVYYIYCFTHQPQLVLVTASKNQGFIVNIVGASCKRKDALLQKYHDHLVKRLENGEIVTRNSKKETSLASPGDTRWVLTLKPYPNFCRCGM
ncbi:hypothetical protein M9H77_13164 [Catharanthus roseus]|uniref:Uncharacterized protein n=1 Tax=Catharanthus roseus TaxID=4058 RepID=A0ACC0BJC3_CATRO|nr:hypothetical protein M9H77_13164 [Catharanthus roseus]